MTNRRLPLLATVFASIVALLAGAVSAKTITGTAGNDVLRGTAAADTLYGKGGADKLYGLTGTASQLAIAAIRVVVASARAGTPPPACEQTPLPGLGGKCEAVD